MHIVIRSASLDDAPTLRGIERRAGGRFHDVGMPEVADDEPLPIEVLARYTVAQRAWVAVDDAGCLIGYVLVDDIDGNAHVEQVSVEPSHQGQGVGHALIERVGLWAAERGMPAITLTTFTDVPWNAPLYRRLGFRVLAEGDIGPGLRAVRDAESAHGLDPETRTCMRRELATSGDQDIVVGRCGGVGQDLVVDVDRSALRPRRADQEDAPGVAEVWLRSRLASVPVIPPSIHADDDVRAWFATIVLPERETWVIEDERAVVALMVLEPGWIEQLYVDPMHTGGGLGSRLVDLAKELNPAGLDLWTFQANAGPGASTSATDSWRSRRPKATTRRQPQTSATTGRTNEGGARQIAGSAQIDIDRVRPQPWPCRTSCCAGGTPA